MSQLGNVAVGNFHKNMEEDYFWLTATSDWLKLWLYAALAWNHFWPSATFDWLLLFTESFSWFKITYYRYLLFYWQLLLTESFSWLTDTLTESYFLLEPVLIDIYFWLKANFDWLLFLTGSYFWLKTSYDWYLSSTANSFWLTQTRPSASKRPQHFRTT